jgi:hypothetical protein
VNGVMSSILTITYPCVKATIPQQSTYTKFETVNNVHRHLSPNDGVANNLTTSANAPAHKHKRPSKIFSIIPALLVTNVRSLLNKVEELTITIRKNNIDVCFLTETWLDESIPNSLIEVDGFSLFRSDRNTNGGGVALYIKNTMVVSQIPLHTIPSITQSSSEILAVFIHHVNIAIIVIYHPFWGNSPHHDSAVMALEDLCDYIRINYTACSSSPSWLLGIIIAGDINDLRLSLEKLCESLNLTSMVHFPTRGSSCLDQIITDLSSLYHVPQCHPPLGRSDHAVVCCQPKKRPPTKIIYKKRVIKALFWDRSFSVVIDYLLPTCSNSEFIKYADDVTVLMYIRNISDDCVNTELENILEWSDKAKFAINWSKTVILNIVTSRQLVLPTIRLISGDEIKEVDQARILGVYFSNDLKWKCHVATILKRARQSLI